MVAADVDVDVVVGVDAALMVAGATAVEASALALLGHIPRRNHHRHRNNPSTPLDT